MNITLEIHPESEFLHVSATGEFSLPEAKRTFLEMLEAAAQHKATKVLFDGRRLTGDPKTIERYDYGEFAAQSVLMFKDGRIPPGAKFAYLLEKPILDSQKFGETVAVNRGMYVMAFDNLEAALAWLGIAPDNEQ